MNYLMPYVHTYTYLINESILYSENAALVLTLPRGVLPLNKKSVLSVSITLTK